MASNSTIGTGGDAAAGAGVKVPATRPSERMVAR